MTLKQYKCLTENNFTRPAPALTLTLTLTRAQPDLTDPSPPLPHSRSAVAADLTPRSFPETV